MNSFHHLEAPRPSSLHPRWLGLLGIVSLAACLTAGCQRTEQSCSACCETNETVSGEAGPEAAVILSAGTPTNETASILSSPWTPPERRPAIPLSHTLTRHDGRPVTLRELTGQPVAISFAYTRCTNPNKCRLVTTTMATLRQQLQAAGRQDKVRLVIISYDASYDTPKVMSDYAARNGLVLDEHTLFLRPALDPANTLFRDLKVNAAFNPAGVTMHGIQLLLLDKSGRLARTYRTLIWNNDDVVKDLARLADE